jgi:ABC-type dipeptide/oligopeptide/nickel transport system permease subunit
VSAPPTLPSAPLGVSYWQIVRRQFAKHRPARWALRGVLALLLLATYAPVLASDRPYYVWTQQDGTRWPWFAALFDRTEVTQSVDLFFNLLMLFLPLGAVVVWAVRRRLLPQGRWRSRQIRRTVGGLVFVFVWVLLGIALPERVVSSGAGKALLAPGLLLRSTKPPTDWHEVVAEEEKAGRNVRAVFPPLPYHYDKTRVRESALEPDGFVGETRRDLGAVGKHPLGTDPGGKDVLTALLFGTRISLTIGVIAVAIYITIGVILGSLAGYFGGWVDILISRLIEVMLCFPVLFFILTIISVFQTRTIFLIMVVIGLTGWPSVARLVRGEFLRERGLDYVTAAKAMAIPERRVIFRHVLPNALTPVLVSATFGIAGAILLESTISFLGLGDTTTASWGLILHKGRMTNMEWLILGGGAAIFVTVTLFNLVGEGLRDALDPKLRA